MTMISNHMLNDKSTIKYFFFKQKQQEKKLFLSLKNDRENFSCAQKRKFIFKKMCKRVVQVRISIQSSASNTLGNQLHYH